MLLAAKTLAAALPAEELQHPCLAVPRVFALREVVKLALSCNYCNNVRKSFLRAYYSKPSAAVTTAINQGEKKNNKKRTCFDHIKLGVGVCYPPRSATDAVPASLLPFPGFARWKLKGFLQLRGINHERGKASLDGSRSSGRRVFPTRGFNPALPGKPHVNTHPPTTTLLSSTNFGFHQSKRELYDPSACDTTWLVKKQEQKTE